MFVIVGIAMFLLGCSVTVGTVNLAQGDSRPKTEIIQQKPVDVTTEAKVPVLP